MKGDGIVQLMTMIAIKRSGLPLNRDIVFIGNADEEFGSTGAIRLRASTSRPAQGCRVPDDRGRRQPGGRRKAGLLRRGRRREADVLAARHGHGNAVTRRRGPRSSTRSRGSSPRSTRSRNTRRRCMSPPGVEKYFHDISVTIPAEQRGWLLDVKKGLENPQARAWILERRLLERHSSQHDLADRASGVEQDERHSGRSERRHRHSTAAGHRSGGVHSARSSGS